MFFTQFSRQKASRQPGMPDRYFLCMSVTQSEPVLQNYKIEVPSRLGELWWLIDLGATVPLVNGSGTSPAITTLTAGPHTITAL